MHDLEWWNNNTIRGSILWLCSVTVLLIIILCFTSNGSLLRGIGLFLLGVGIAPIGLFLANKRTESLKIQTTVEEAQAATEKKKAETEAFAKSVELLGNKRETARQGGIHALGRLAEENKDLHPMIMNIVASYIRSESNTWVSKKDKEKEEKNKKPANRSSLIEELSLGPMPMDIEAAIRVIRERNTDFDEKLTKEDKGYFMDLSNAYIFNADFSNTNLRRVIFSDSVMIKSIFSETNLSGSDFTAADLSGSDFTAADLSGSDFTACTLSGADISGCDLRDSLLTQNQVDSMKYVDKPPTLPDELQPPPAKKA